MDQEENEEYAYRAAYGNTTIKGQSFLAVGDALIERGFNMAAAAMDGRGNLLVPHTLPRRRPAKVWFEQPPAPEPPPPPPPSEEDLRLDQVIHDAYEAVYSGRVQPGIQTRSCGAVHSEGVVCFIPVLFEALHCGCGDMSFPHEEAHEAVDEEGVRYRWEEVLMIQDLPFDAYASREASA
jgi:hypothetical protein